MKEVKIDVYYKDVFGINGVPDKACVTVTDEGCEKTVDLLEAIPNVFDVVDTTDEDYAEGVTEKRNGKIPKTAAVKLNGEVTYHIGEGRK